jgi:hypothetical protein
MEPHEASRPLLRQRSAPQLESATLKRRHEEPKRQYDAAMNDGSIHSSEFLRSYFKSEVRHKSVQL